MQVVCKRFGVIYKKALGTVRFEFADAMLYDCGGNIQSDISIHI